MTTAGKDNLTRDEALAQVRIIVAATDLPVSADLEKGFGDAPSVVAETVQLAAQAGLVGNTNQKAYLIYAANQIKRFQDDPKKMNLTKPNDPPDGQPIGMDWSTLSERDWCDWP